MRSMGLPSEALAARGRTVGVPRLLLHGHADRMTGALRGLRAQALIDDVAAALGGHTRVERIPTPGDCTDGFFEAFWRRPEALLDPAVRSAQSVWALLEPSVERRIVDRLAAALDSGAWDAEYGHLRKQESFQGALRLVISEAA